MKLFVYINVITTNKSITFKINSNMLFFGKIQNTKTKLIDMCVMPFHFTHNDSSCVCICNVNIMIINNASKKIIFIISSKISVDFNREHSLCFHVSGLLALCAEHSTYVWTTKLCYRHDSAWRAKHCREGIVPLSRKHVHC